MKRNGKTFLGQVRRSGGAESDYRIGAQIAEPRALNLGKSLQILFTQLLLLLSLGLLSRGEWGPALVVLSAYVVTLVINAPVGFFYKKFSR